MFNFLISSTWDLNLFEFPTIIFEHKYSQPRILLSYCCLS